MKNENKGNVIKIEIPISQAPDAAKVLQRSTGYIVIELDKTTYLIRETDVPLEILELLRLQKEEKLSNDVEISVIKSDTLGIATSTEEQFVSTIDKLPLGLNDYYKGLFLSSMDANDYYKSGNKKAGDRAKSEIKPIYGAPGILFCNLYTQNYIPKALEYFANLGGDLKNESLNEFLNIFIKYWDSVFFINRTHDMGFYYPNFKSAVLSQKEYIALHAIASLNIHTEHKILEKLSEEGIDLKALGYEVIPKEGATPTGLSKKDIYIFTEAGKEVYEFFQKLT